MKRSKLKLGAQTLRHLTAAQLAGAQGGGRTQSGDACGLICSENPSCQRCDTIAPDCLTTSSTTF